MSLPVAVGSRARQEEIKRGRGEREREMMESMQKKKAKRTRGHTRDTSVSAWEGVNLFYVGRGNRNTFTLLH